MRNQRMALGLAAAACITTILTACGSDGDTGDGSVSAKLPHHMPADSSDGKCIQDFADQTKENANIDFEITPAGALGGEADVEENLFQGVFEATLMSNVLMGVWEESAQVTNLPYVIPDIETGRALLESDIMQPVYDALLENKGARLLGYCHYSMRDIAATRAIRGVDDLGGMKIRVPETDAFVKTFETLGANPTALPFPEVYNAMKTEVVDAAESNFADMLGLKFNEVAPYFSRTHHMFTGQALVVNEEWFQSLTQEQQDGLTEAAKSAEDTSFQERLAANEALAPELEAAGVTVVDDVDHAAFREAVAPLRKELASEYGVTELLAEVLAFVEQNG